jgi:magnesium chelatase subunit I
MERIPELWPRAFEANAADDPGVRASCVEFLLAGLHATDRISRSERFGHTIYESDR